MSTGNIVHVGDVGLDIILSISEDGSVLDITGATDITIILRAPTDSLGSTTRGELKTKTGIIKVAAEGTIYFSTIAGDLDIEGEWTVQGNFTLGTWTGRTQKATFIVMPKI